MAATLGGCLAVYGNMDASLNGVKWSGCAASEGGVVVDSTSQGSLQLRDVTIELIDSNVTQVRDDFCVGDSSPPPALMHY